MPGPRRRRGRERGARPADLVGRLGAGDRGERRDRAGPAPVHPRLAFVAAGARRRDGRHEPRLVGVVTRLAQQADLPALWRRPSPAAHELSHIAHRDASLVCVAAAPATVCPAAPSGAFWHGALAPFPSLPRGGSPWRWALWLLSRVASGVRAAATRTTTCHAASWLSIWRSMMTGDTLKRAAI